MNTGQGMSREVSSQQPYVASVIIRGQVIDTDLIEFGGRGAGDIKFLSPDPHTFLDLLALGHPGKMADLYELSFSVFSIISRNWELALDLATNPHLQQAMAGSILTAPTTPPIVEYCYKALRMAFDRQVLTEMAEQTVGIKYLEGWVPSTLVDGRVAHIRAFGSRALHIVAGNAPLISALTIARNAISRSDTIIKSPSNDPFTALAVVQTCATWRRTIH